MTDRKTRERSRVHTRREEEKERSVWKEYKIIFQLLVCITLVIAFVFTQGMVVYENRTVRDYVKQQLNETTNVKETIQYVKQFVDAKRLWPEAEEASAPVSATVQPETSPSPAQPSAAPEPSATVPVENPSPVPAASGVQQVTP